ncbi:iron-siderophore ABC transporter substrate-binding protein [Marinomonas sp. TI.3.20]|uniref:iron-siderophore ABC transporter substrate-binding protein n=1 Tax=Marinomonas sp. TI.3.20 TaxID=3121296 RepID=UPI00311F4ADC
MFSARSFCHTALITAGLTCAMSALAADHIVSTKYGDVKVNNNIKRIVTLYEGALDISYALEVEPVGAIAAPNSDMAPTYFGDQTKGINIVGTTHNINLKAVAAAHPDVILAPTSLSADEYKLLSKIAPTIVPKLNAHASSSWEDDTRLFGKVFNKSQEAKAVIDNIHDREADIKNIVEVKVPNTQLSTSVIHWTPQGALIMSSNTFANSVLESTGFKANDDNLVKKGSLYSGPLDLKKLAKIDSNWLFLATPNVDSKKALKTVEKTTVFTQINAIKKGHVIPVSSQVWTDSSGPIAANIVLDDIQNLLDNHISYPE